VANKIVWWRGEIVGGVTSLTHDTRAERTAGETNKQKKSWRQTFM